MTEHTQDDIPESTPRAQRRQLWSLAHDVVLVGEDYAAGLPGPAIKVGSGEYIDYPGRVVITPTDGRELPPIEDIPELVGWHRGDPEPRRMMLKRYPAPR